MAIAVSTGTGVTNIPGAYGRVRINPQVETPFEGFGSCLIIDTGELSSGWGGLSGVLGTNANRRNSFYEFRTFSSFLDVHHGGALVPIVNKLFVPGGNANRGISSLYYIRAASTTPASRSVNLANGSFTITTLDEGLYANSMFHSRQSVDATLTISSSFDPANAAFDNGLALSLTAIGVDGVTYNLGSYSVDDLTPVSGNIDRALLTTNLVNAINDARSAIVASSTAAGVITLSTRAGRLGSDQLAGASISISATNTEDPPVAIPSTVDLIESITAFANTPPPNTNNLYKGYLLEVTSDDITLENPAYRFSFYRGTWQGRDEAISLLAEDTVNIDGTDIVDSQRELLIQTPELRSIQELHDWASRNDIFRSYFRFSANIPDQEGAFTGSSAANDDSEVLIETSPTDPVIHYFTGGSEEFSPDAFRAALDVAPEGRTDFILLGDSGEAADSANNQLVASLFSNQQEQPTIYVGGGNTSGGLEDSNGAARSFNSELVKIVHSGVDLAHPFDGTRNKGYTSLMHASIILGLDASRPPNEHLTGQLVPIAGLSHLLSTAEVEEEINNGVFLTDLRSDGFRVVHDINTTQGAQNEVTFSADASYLGVVLKLKRVLIRSSRNYLNRLLQEPNQRRTINKDISQLQQEFRNFLSGFIVVDGSSQQYLRAVGNVTASRLPNGDFRFGADVSLNLPANFAIITLTVNQGTS